MLLILIMRGGTIADCQQDIYVCKIYRQQKILCVYDLWATENSVCKIYKAS